MSERPQGKGGVSAENDRALENLKHGVEDVTERTPSYMENFLREENEKLLHRNKLLAARVDGLVDLIARARRK